MKSSKLDWKFEWEALAYILPKKVKLNKWAEDFIWWKTETIRFRLRKHIFGDVGWLRLQHSSKENMESRKRRM